MVQLKKLWIEFERERCREQRQLEKTLHLTENKRKRERNRGRSRGRTDERSIVNYWSVYYEKLTECRTSALNSSILLHVSTHFICKWTCSSSNNAEANYLWIMLSLNCYTGLQWFQCCITVFPDDKWLWIVRLPSINSIHLNKLNQSVCAALLFKITLMHQDFILFCLYYL